MAYLDDLALQGDDQLVDVFVLREDHVVFFQLPYPHVLRDLQDLVHRQQLQRRVLLEGPQLDVPIQD